MNRVLNPFAALLLVGHDGVDARSDELPAGTDVETVLDNHIPPFARIRADEWAVIDADEVDAPKPPIRHTGAIGDAYEAREPLPSYDPENDQLEHFGAIADIIERGGIGQ